MSRIAISARSTLAAFALAAGLAILPGAAAAADVTLLHTGTPNLNSPTPAILASNQSFAVEFSATAGETITDLAAYLTQGTNQSGQFFTFELFSGASFVGNRNAQPLFTPVTATYTGPGWNSQAVNWAISTTGNYWLALVAGSGTSFDLYPEATTGNVPAEGFAFRSSSSYASTTTSFGAQITGVSPVPEPSTAIGMLLGLAALGAAGLKRRARS